MAAIPGSPRVPAAVVGLDVPTALPSYMGSEKGEAHEHHDHDHRRSAVKYSAAEQVQH